jgi:uncharacterized damage-inducible protein DinB
MGREVDRLVEQIRRAFEGEAWHGPSVREALAGVGAEDAAAHPIAGAHGIWELVLHLGGTYGLVLRRLQGNGAQLTPEEDWPPVPAPSADAWAAAVRALHELNRELRLAAGALPDDRLDEPLVPESPYPAFTQLAGVPQHDLYHAGQIVLLKRALGR